MDFNEVVTVVVADGSPTEESVEEVVIFSTVVVEAEKVVLMVDRALREDSGDGDDTPPFLKMVLIVACRGCHTAHVLCSLADYQHHWNLWRWKTRS